MTAPPTRQGTAERYLGLAAAVAVSAGVLWYFHDVFWYGPDEGAYAHVAERILDGEVLGRDVKEIHAGYVNFANALAMRLFGETLVSLRYPLVAMGVAQAALVYWLVAPRGRLTALIASGALTALSTVQFLNPTAHWYALFITIVIVFLLHHDRLEAPGRLEAVGFLLVALFLFRQLSGVIVALGVLAWLIDRMDDGSSRNAVLGRALLGVMTLGLAGYLRSKTDELGFLLIGVWPLGMLVVLLVRTRIGDRAAWRIVRRLALGGGLAALPLAAYLIAHGSLVEWFGDAFVTPLRLTELAFMSKGWYAPMLVVAGINVLRLGSLHEALNGLFWVALLLAPAAVGCLAWRRLYPPREARDALPPILFIPPFYALVSIHYQIPIYVFYAAGLTAAALCYALAAARPARLRAIGLGGVLCLAGIGLYYQAGQPLARGLGGIVIGAGGLALEPCPSPRCGLRIDRADAALYRGLIAAIERHSAPGETILALPANPELYFLTERRNPFRFFNAALGITDEAGLAAALARARADPPRLVIYHDADKYNTPLAKRLWQRLKPGYAQIEALDGFEVYGRKPGPDNTAGARGGPSR